MSERAASEPDRARIEALWDTVVALPEGERATFLSGSELDQALRGELDSLLARVEGAETFFGRLAALMPEVVEAVAQAEDGQAATALPSSTSDRSMASADPLLGQTVGHYRVEERLGAGGMGVVYRAYDLHLQRTVALKFLAAPLHADAKAQARFLVEARAAAALDHANICTIHEVGGSADTPSFIAMAFYPGETLEQVLRQGPLPLSLAVDYTVQIARALSAAHAQGISHGDVKPGNVMITAGDVVKLLDFGIARLAAATSQPEVTPGTIAYMSPEQVRAAPADSRSDLWSLGVVCYELCTGVRPFGGDDQSATLHAILTAEPPAPSSLRPEVPAQIDAVIDRLLKKDPAERYARVEELLAELERALAPGPTRSPEAAPPPRRSARVRRAAIVLGLIALLTAAAGVQVLRGPAVPLRILVADAEGDTLTGRTVSERLRQVLAAPGLAVVGRPALQAALVRMGRDPAERLTPETARDVAIREGFKGFVHVTVDRIGKAFAIGGVLVEAESGDLIDHHQAVALNAAELPGAIDQLASGLRQAFGRSLEIMPDNPALLAVTTDSTSALKLHLEAVQANRSGDFRRGIGLHDETIAIDPEFADAHQTRAFALEQIGLRAGRAQNSIMRAAALRSRLTRHERYSLEADFFWQVRGDLASAIASLRNAHRAVQEIEPGRVLNRRSYGLALMLHGDLAEAESVLQEGRRFAPCPATNTHLVSVLHALGKDAEARSVLDRALRQWPTNPLLGMDRAHFLARAGKYREAQDAARRLQRGPTLPFGLRAEAVFDAVAGRLDEARGHLQRLRDDNVAAGFLAPAHETAVAMGRLRLVAGDTLAAVREVEAFITHQPLRLMPAAERPYLSLALFFADAREPRRAAELLADYDTLVPRVYQGPDGWMQRRVRAAMWLAGDRPAEALREWQGAAGTDRIWSSWLDNLLLPADAHPDLARVHDRLGHADSAIVVFERYLNAKVLYRAELDAFHQAHALRRLAVLYTQRNEPERAAYYQRQLAELWRDADPGLKRAWHLR